MNSDRAVRRAKCVLALALILILAGGLLSYLIETDGCRIKIKDVTLRRNRRENQQRPAVHPAGCEQQEPRSGDSGDARIHQFPRNAGRFRDRIRPARVRCPGPRSDGAWFFGCTVLQQRFWRLRYAEVPSVALLCRSGEHRPRGPFHGRLGIRDGRLG